MTTSIPALLEPIQARLDAAWCEIGEGCPAQSCKRNRETARLLAAVKAVTALPHEDYCCTKGCPGFGLATCGKVHKNGDECDGSECSCFMSGPLRAIEAALRGEA